MRTLFHLNCILLWKDLAQSEKHRRSIIQSLFVFRSVPYPPSAETPKRKADALQEDAGKLSRNRKNRLNRFRIVSRESVVASCRRAARSLPLPIIHDLLSFCKRFHAFSDFSAQVTKTRAPICLFSYTSTHHGLQNIRGIMYYPHII